MNISVCIVEDNLELRDSVSTYLDAVPGFCCLGAYESAEEALIQIPLRRPDVVLMDINLPGMSGIDCVRELKRAEVRLPVIMLTVYENSDQVFDALAAGACGYMIKSTPQEKLLEAIREVQNGGSPMSSNIARKVVQSFLRNEQRNQSMERLSPREQQVLEQLSKGFPYKQISAEMEISMGTLHTYIRRVYEKLHVNCRTDAVVKYLGVDQRGR
ncbi:MAG: DNA-binding response regulator [Verrucomicrobiales bacterium]|nr:DNA-binding response regulator [Verrucomicrobiales bacterium]